MSFDSLLVRTATVEPWGPTEVDDFNDEIAGYGEPVTYPAWFDQVMGGTPEITVGEETAITVDKLILPAGAIIDHLSRVTRDDGEVFQAWGEPWRVYTPRGEHHVEIRIRSVEDQDDLVSS